jgi:aspartate aminotransferase
LNSPSNPTGSAYTKEELKSIAQVLLPKDIMVISDEIYEKIVYDDFAFVSFASIEPGLKDRTIVVNGVSKTYSMTGWRIGYAAGPKHIIAAMTNIQSQSTSNPTSIAQKASLAALNGDQDCVQMMLKEFDKRRKYMVERLNTIPGISCFKPVGAFYVFPNVSGVYGKKSGNTTITDSTSFSQYLLEHAKVAVVPGIGFGADENVRLSFATSSENIEKGLDRIQKAVEDLQ